MKIQLTALALVTLATLGTACDPEPTTGMPDASTFRTETFIPPTGTTGTVLVGKGGHGLPVEVLTTGYDRAPYEIQVAFFEQMEKQVVKSLESDFLAVEQNYEECPWICDGAGLSWDEGVYISDLRYEIGTVSLAEDPTGLHWQTEVRGEAQVGCGCI